MLGILVFLYCISIVEASLFSPQGQKGVLDYHNKIRSEIAHGKFLPSRPPGSNILKMVWNESLANSADEFSQRNPKTHSHEPGIGENIYWHWSSQPGSLDKYGKMAAESWIDEFMVVDWDTNLFTDELFGQGVGHATQMVWAETDQVGCAFSSFQENYKQTGRLITKICVVCHYWPKGNYLNEPIYLEGTLCSECDKKKCDNDLGLCE